jgi:hypothetical protein
MSPEMSTDNEGSASVLDEVLGSAEDSNMNEGGSNEGSDTSGSPGIDPKAFNDLVNSVNGMQNLVGKWGNEMGEFRNMVSQNAGGGSADNTDTSDGSNDIWNQLMDNPEATLEKKFSEFQNKQQTQAQQKAAQSREQIKSFIPDFDSIQDDVIGTIAKDVGADKASILRDLHTIEPAVLVNVSKRVQAEKKLAEATKLFEAMKNQGVDFDQAKRALSRSPQSGDSFNPPSSTDTPNVNIRNLSDEQRTQLMMKRGILKK